MCNALFFFLFIENDVLIKDLLKIDNLFLKNFLLQGRSLSK